MSVPNWRTKPQTKIVYYAPDGELYTLHNPPDKVVVGMSGWGLSPRDTMTTRGPYQQGDTVIGQRLTPREISMTVHHNGEDKTDYWGNRGTLVDTFRENRTNLNYPTPGRLRFIYQVNGVPVVRELKVFFNEGFVFQPENLQYWDGYAIRESVSFVAHDPIVYDPTLVDASVPILEQHLILPMTFPFVLNTFSGYSTITYTGTWESFPVIEIMGPVKNPVIYNYTTDKIIRLEVYVALDETITIMLDYDQRSITSNVRGDMSYTVVESDLSNFSLREAPIAPGGVNEIVLYAEEYVPGISNFSLEYYNRYRGI